MSFSIIVLILLINLMTIAHGDDPIVKIANGGQLKGKIIKTREGDCHAFFGVPFAEPPVRFAKPQPVKPWTGIREAKQSPPICIQSFGNATNPKEESEDCLYLNIFAPSTAIKSTKSIPVMVFLHGGAWVFGSARDYSHDGACENLATRDVIIVIPQYRLNFYGFFTTETDAAKGNYGLWDNIEALKWVKENIAHFGGDPNKVTLFGQSAGGSSVSLLSYTPIAEGLFHQLIIESGSALTYNSGPRDSFATEKGWIDPILLRATNCTNPDSNVALECLRRIPAPILQRIAQVAFSQMTYLGMVMGVWQPRIDGELLKKVQLEEISNKPTIIGVTSMDSLTVPKVSDIPNANALFNASLEAAFKGDNLTQKAILDELVENFYIDSKGDWNDPKFVCEQNAKLHMDMSVVVPAAREAILKTNAGTPVWVYEFDHYSQNNFAKDFPFDKGAPHAHELCYLFLIPEDKNAKPKFMTCPEKYEGEDECVADYMGEMWTNFAKRGNPSPDDTNWPKFQNIDQANTMHINSDLEIDPTFFSESTKFWTILRPSIDRIFSREGKT